VKAEGVAIFDVYEGDSETKESDDKAFLTTSDTVLGGSGECGVQIVLSTTVVVVTVPRFWFLIAPELSS